MSYAHYTILRVEPHPGDLELFYLMLLEPGTSAVPVCPECLERIHFAVTEPILQCSACGGMVHHKDRCMDVGRHSSRCRSCARQGEL